MIAMTLAHDHHDLGYILRAAAPPTAPQDASARVQDTGRFALEFIAASCVRGADPIFNASPSDAPDEYDPADGWTAIAGN